jgi:16S rRNA processing protein RimM
MSSTEVVVGRIGKPHGVRGELTVELRTDEPDRRFSAGSVLRTRTPQGGAPHGPHRPETLTVRATRWHQSRLLVIFEEVTDRNAAEAVRGLVLAVEVDLAEMPEDPEEFYDHQLMGLAVVTADGRAVGELAGVVHGSAQDLLSVRAADDGREILVPFVRELVPEIDLEGGRVVVTDIPGLLEPVAEDEAGGA